MKLYTRWRLWSTRILQGLVERMRRDPEVGLEEFKDFEELVAKHVAEMQRQDRDKRTTAAGRPPAST